MFHLVNLLTLLAGGVSAALEAVAHPPFAFLTSSAFGKTPTPTHAPHSGVLGRSTSTEPGRFQCCSNSARHTVNEHCATQLPLRLILVAHRYPSSNPIAIAMSMSTETSISFSCISILCHSLNFVKPRIDELTHEFLSLPVDIAPSPRYTS